MVKANCKQSKRGPTVAGKGFGAHLLESRPSLPIQTCDFEDKLSEKICSSVSLTISRNPSIQTYLIPEEKHSGTGLVKLPSAPEPERDVAELQKITTAVKYLDDFCKKKRELSALQTKLIKVQNEYIKLYAEVRKLRAIAGEDPGDSVGDMRLVSVKDWPAHDLLLLVRDDARVHKHAEVNGVIGPEVLHGLNSELTTIPAEFLSVGTELIEERSKMLDYFLEKRGKLNFYNSVEWKKKNAEFDAETKRLQCLVTARANKIKAKITHCLRIAKMSWIDRESLIHQMQLMQKMLSDHRNPVGTGKQEKVTEENQKLAEALDKERNARAKLSDMLAAADHMINGLRARANSFEFQLNKARAELATTTRQIENLKLCYARREANSYARMKKLENESKINEETIQLLYKQRDALEKRVGMLQQQASVIMSNGENSETRWQSHIAALNRQLDEQVQLRKTAETKIMSMEKCLKDSHDRYMVLQERTRELIELQRKNCINFMHKKEIHPTVKEVEIWNDLQVTRKALEQVRSELARSRADKDGLLDSLAKIAREGSENSLAEELIIKEQKISRMQSIIEEKKENERRMEQSIIRYEDQLDAVKLEMTKLRCHTSRYINNDSSKFGASKDEKLEEEVLNLCRRVESLNRERAALVSAVASRALMLERHERCAELFAQVTRTRRWLAAQIEDRRSDMDQGSSNIEIVNPSSSAAADLTWPASQAERVRKQPLTPLESPTLEKLILARTASLEKEITEKIKQVSKHDNVNDETQFYYSI